MIAFGPVPSRRLGHSLGIKNILLKNLHIDQIFEGLIQLRKDFTGKIYLEIFFVPKLNDTKEELILLKETSHKIKPDLVQLNTLDRPGTENWVKSVSREKLKEISGFFKSIPVEIIAKTETRKQIQSFNQNIADQILETIKRRPCTDTELSKILNLHLNELNKYLSELIDNKVITSERKKRGIFFKIYEFTSKDVIC
jgi:wyosine [tRNA(Phe)-imidazoG37] synthetase (radical SAM superfamily)